MDANGEPAVEPICEAGVNRFGAESVSFSPFTDGAGVTPVTLGVEALAVPSGDGRLIDEVVAAGEAMAVTINCSPLVMGMDDR